MGKSKIDKERLAVLLNQGWTLTACAKEFGVSVNAVSKARKRIQTGVVKNVTLESAHLVVGQGLLVVDQLHKINENANELLDLLMRWSRGDEIAEHALKKKLGPEQKPESREGLLFGEDAALAKLEWKFADPRSLAIKVMGEIRGQLSLQIDIFKQLYDMKAIEEFQTEVLAAIGDVDPDVRDRIVHKLNEKRAIRHALAAG